MKRKKVNNIPSILHLTLKKKWFDMIAKGIKKEEYRAVKPYWEVRLLNGSPLNFKTFDEIIFKNGYGKNDPTMRVEFKGISIGKAVPEWSDNWKGDVFKIKIGKIKQIRY